MLHEARSYSRLVCARSVADEIAPREAAISHRQDSFSEIHFGRTLGSPPGLPGGGITGVLPVSGAGARMAGSTSEGGHSTPSDSASLSPSGSLERPTVRPSGVVSGFVAPQRAEGWSGGGAVLSGGVAAVGGACAMATPGATISSRAANKDGLHRIRQERRSRAIVPALTHSFLTIALDARAVRPDWNQGVPRSLPIIQSKGR